MAIEKQIIHIRNLRELTQKSKTRVTKDNLLSTIAEILHVSPKALTVPGIDNYLGIMQTLFAL